MNLWVVLLISLISWIGAANAVEIGFVKNESATYTIVVKSRTDERQFVVITAGETKNDINLPGDAVVEYQPKNASVPSRAKIYLQYPGYVGIKVDENGDLYRANSKVGWIPL